jgi:hypothetical protein
MHRKLLKTASDAGDKNYINNDNRSNANIFIFKSNKIVSFVQIIQVSIVQIVQVSIVQITQVSFEQIIQSTYVEIIQASLIVLSFTTDCVLIL